MRQSTKYRLPACSALAAAAVCGLVSSRPAQAKAIGDELALTVYLPIKDLAGAETAAAALQTPGDPSFHKFLGTAAFAAKYGASASVIAAVENKLQEMGFTVSTVFANHLAIEAVSSASTAATAFGLTLHSITVAGRTGIASATPPRIPAALAGLIRGVAGFNSVTHPRPLHHAVAVRPAGAIAGGASLAPGGQPGDYLPADYIARYDVAPIRARGLDGKGVTIGIVTLNDFRPSDAYAFWSQTGLTVSPSRITRVDVDGGFNASSNNLDGEGETDLDVEQSGSIAPAADVRVYIAPNITDANFLNAFEAAASENIADTLSTSWGEPELYYFFDQATQTPGQSFLLRAYHDVFLEMALQGQTLFAATGDSGSFDTVEGCSPYAGTPTPQNPVCNAPYSVDHPAVDPLITGAGGTSTPFAFTTGSGIKLFVKKEQAWSWEYILDEEQAQGQTGHYGIVGLFSVGDGGGVSSFFGVPAYQAQTAGITRTRPGQVLTQDTGSGPVLQYKLKSGFAGRNLPDISTGADPESGYQLIERGQVSDFNGGTSFVAPQLNGVTALLVQALGGRVGQLNPALYALAGSATTDNTAYNNWGYRAHLGYDNAVGVGVLDADKLLSGLMSFGKSP